MNRHPAEDHGVDTCVEASIATREPMFALRWWMPFVAFVPAYLLRLFSIASAVSPVDDMFMHVQNALYYPQGGLLGPDNWWTGPVKHVGLRWASVVFGNDIVGWRLPAVLLGALSVLLAALVARRLFRTVLPALVVVVLYTFDPLAVAFARTTFEDTATAAILLGAVLFWLRAIEDDSTFDWLACGLTIGLGVAYRQYVLVPAALMLITTLYVYRKAGFASVMRVALPVLCVAVTAYAVTWLPWLSRGYSLAEWWRLQVDALAVQGSNFRGFSPAMAGMADPQGWFLRWVGLWLGRPVEGGQAISLMSNDPIVWVLFIPATAYLAVQSVRRARPEWLFVAAGFLGVYAFFALAQRPIMVYSALIMLPFGFLAMGYAVSRLPSRAAMAFLIAALVWGAYLYPLAAGVAVSAQPYTWLLQRVQAVGVGS